MFTLSVFFSFFLLFSKWLFLPLLSDKNRFTSSRAFCQLHCQTCPYQTCSFQHYYQLSSGDGYRSSLQLSFIFLWWRSFTIPDTKVAPFPYLMWEVIFHCLRSFSSSFYKTMRRIETLQGQNVSTSRFLKVRVSHWNVLTLSWMLIDNCDLTF